MRIIRYLFFIFFLIGAFSIGTIFFVLHNKIIDFSALEHYNPGSPTILLDDEGNEWARFQLDRREPITLDKMPKDLINAVIATEDWAFFEHFGLSFKGIIRSIVKNLYHGRKVQGASTITQQLVRLLFFDQKKTFWRKIKEQIFSLLVERQFTKEQILETYLNHVCFGHGIYGVQAATQRFWGKKIAEISLDEAAILVGSIQSPENYYPAVYPLSAQRRRNIVLSQMKKLKFITDDQYKEAKSKPVKVVEYKPNKLSPHLKEHIRIFLEHRFGKKKLYNGGLIVQTTLNKKIQQVANKTFREQHETLQKNISEKVDGALISIDVPTGEIKALIGGAHFAISKFNRVFQSKRQMGSVFKPILYSAAIMHGMSFADTKIDEPIEVVLHDRIWKPNNAFLKFDGQMTLAWALSVSNNIVAIKTFLAIGASSIIELAKKCRLNCDFHQYPSLALGCVDVTPKDVAGMFNIFANNGTYVEPHCIRWVKNLLGAKIWKANFHRERVILPRVTGQVAKVLELGLKRIRKLMPQKWVDSQSISKTGTTNDSRICWFVGSTPTLTTAVYIGRDDNKSMGKNIYPLRTAFPIWMGLNRELQFDRKKFSFDPSLQEICINRKTGEPTLHATDPDAITIFV